MTICAYFISSLKFLHCDHKQKICHVDRFNNSFVSCSIFNNLVNSLFAYFLVFAFRAKHAVFTHLIVGEGAVLVDGIHLGDLRADRFALQHRFLFALGEQWNLIVDILQHNVDGRLAGQLLGTVVLCGGLLEIRD